MIIVAHTHVFVSLKVAQRYVFLQWTRLMVLSCAHNNGKFPLSHVHICWKLDMDTSS